MEGLERILEVIRATKNYALLEGLDWQSLTVNARRIIDQICVGMLQDSNEQALLTLDEFYQLDHEDISYLCGANKCDPSLVSKCKLFALPYYLRGIAKADDLDAFLSVRDKRASEWTGYSVRGEEANEDVREMLGRYFAPRIMDHIGYDKESLGLYLVGACLEGNEESLLHLAQKEGTTELFESMAFFLHHKLLEKVLSCLVRGGAIFEDKFWFWLREKRSQVYAVCQVDV